MAEFRLSFGTYAVVSTLSVLTLILRTWYVHEELYTIIAVLTNQKVALAILYNFVFMLFVGSGRLVFHLLLGQLRDLEVEQVLDSGRGFLLDTVLFLVLSSPTLDGADVSTYALAKFLLLIVALKTAHLVVQIQGTTMFEVGHPRAPAVLRICVVLSALLSLDVFAVHFFLMNASRQSTFYLWLLFECLGMLASCAICGMKFCVHLVDLRLDNGWSSKSAVIFYLELMHDVTSLVIFLLFMTVFFVTQPSRLPLYMTADIIHVVKALYKRILSLKKYRSLTRNLETRFPDATSEELEAADTCIICRDYLYEGSKKLPCSHIFHIDCLRSWLVQQQSCPTCRADIPTDDAAASAAAAARSASRSTEQSSARTTRESAVQEPRQRSRDFASQQQQHLHGAADAHVSAGSHVAEGSSANAGDSVVHREDKRLSQSGRDGSQAAAAGDGLAEELGIPGVSALALGVARGLRSSARRMYRAQVNVMTEHMELLNRRSGRGTGRIGDTEGPYYPTATPSAATVAPRLQALTATPGQGQTYAEEVDAALWRRVAQAEAVITNSLTQAVAMTYQMCDLYRLHASLWTIEAQRAQLDACHSLLRDSESRRSSSVVARAEIRDAEDIRAHPSGTMDNPDNLVPSADSPTRPTGGPARPPLPADPLGSDVERHAQASGVVTADKAPGLDKALDRKGKVLYVACPSAGGEGASSSSSSHAKGSTGSTVGRAESEGESSEHATTGPHKEVVLMQGDDKAADFIGNVAVAEEPARATKAGEQAAGKQSGQTSEREYVVICPSHVFHQAVLPYLSHCSEMPVASSPPGADGRFRNEEGIRGNPDGYSSRAKNTQSGSAGITLQGSGALNASAAASSASKVLGPGMGAPYHNSAAVGGWPSRGLWTTTPVGWQSAGSIPVSALPPLPPFPGYSSSNWRPSVAAHQQIGRAGDSLSAAAAEHGRPPTASQASTDVSLPFSPWSPVLLPFPAYTMAADPFHCTISREADLPSHPSTSPRTAPTTDVVAGAASVGAEEEQAGDRSAGARTSGSITDAMAVDLKRLREEQHRRWAEEYFAGRRVPEM